MLFLACSPNLEQLNGLEKRTIYAHIFRGSTLSLFNTHNPRLLIVLKLSSYKEEICKNGNQEIKSQLLAVEIKINI